MRLPLLILMSLGISGLDCVKTLRHHDWPYSFGTIDGTIPQWQEDSAETIQWLSVDGPQTPFQDLTEIARRQPLPGERDSAAGVQLKRRTGVLSVQPSKLTLSNKISRLRPQPFKPQQQQVSIGLVPGPHKPLQPLKVNLPDVNDIPDPPKIIEKAKEWREAAQFCLAVASPVLSTIVASKVDYPLLRAFEKLQASGLLKSIEPTAKARLADKKLIERDKLKKACAQAEKEANELRAEARKEAKERKRGKNRR